MNPFQAPKNAHKHVLIAPPELGARTEPLRQALIALCAADVGFVSVDSPRVADERSEILEVLPRAKTLISFCMRMKPRRDSLEASLGGHS